MSYSTMLYAVDIGELKSACGSKNQSLLASVRKVLQDSEGGNTPVDPTKGPRVNRFSGCRLGPRPLCYRCSTIVCSLTIGL